MKKRRLGRGWLAAFLLPVCAAIAGVAMLAVLWLAAPSAETPPHALRILPAVPLLTPSPAQPEPARLAETPISVLVSPAATGPAPAEIEPPLPLLPAPARLPDTPPVQPASPPEPLPAIGRLVIPKLHLDAPVIESPVAGESWQVSHLGQSVGHLAGTANPGEAGNVVLAGHVTLVGGEAGPFEHLAELQPSDEIILVSGGRRVAYRVSGTQTVDPAAIEVTYPSAEPEITLLTCASWDSNNHRYTDRLVVRGFSPDVE